MNTHPHTPRTLLLFILLTLFAFHNLPLHATPPITTSFPATDFTQSGGALRPFSELAAGPDHLLAIAGSTIAVYDKSGTLLQTTGAVDLMQDECSENLHTPVALYDEEAARWLIGYGAYGDAGNGDDIEEGYCLAVSQTGDPTGDYTVTYFPLSTSVFEVDFPQAGVGDDHIVVGYNIFEGSDHFIESALIAIDKSALYAADPSPPTVQHAIPAGRYTPQPLNLHGFTTNSWPQHTGSHYVLADNGNGTDYALFLWDLNANDLSHVGDVSLGSGPQPVNAVQNSPDPIDVVDRRPLDFEFRDGYGWTTMTIACDPGSGVVNCVRWAQINLDDATLGPAATGVYGTDGDYRYYPDLAVNHCGDIVLGYTRSSANDFPGIAIAGRQFYDAPAALQNEIELKAGETAFVATGPAPYRWGEYTAMTIDPDGFTFWYMGQYSKDLGAVDANWGTYIGAFSYDQCTLNRAPHAFDNAYTTTQNTALMVDAPGILGNDQDQDDDALTTLLVDGPDHGALDLDLDGAFTYTPDSDYDGSDSFTYRATDGENQSNVATVHLTIAFVNQPPTAADDAYNTPEDATLDIAAPGVLANDSDPDNDTLSATLVDGPDHGSLTLQTNGAFTYTPEPDFHGADTFTYRAGDSQTSSDSASVTLTITPVNDSPTATDHAYTTPEDTPLVIATPGVLTNATDPEGDTLSATLVDGPDHGTLALQTNGAFTYTPDPDYHGSDAFTYRADDGASQSNLATVTLTITPVDDPPQQRHLYLPFWSNTSRAQLRSMRSPFFRQHPSMGYNYAV